VSSRGANLLSFRRSSRVGRRNLHRLLVLTCSWLFTSAPLWAQQPDDPVASAQMHFGPLGVTPSLALRNFGVDSNVFNEVDAPKQDFTFTVSPQANLWSRVGRARLAGDARVDLIYFQRYATERSLDGDVGGRVEIAANRVIPWVAGRFFRGRQRAGFEIDARSRRVSEDFSFGTDARITAKTRVGVVLRRMTTAFDGDVLFLGTSLSEALDRTSDTLAAHYRQALTPLTTFVLQADAVQDRFVFSTIRNADSVRVQAGFDLAPSALISGQVRFGFRKFDPLEGAVRGNRGLTADVSAAATVANRARLDLNVQRDISFSFEPIYPYYVLTAATATLTPRLTDHWDIQTRLGVQRLAYSGFEATAALPDRVDRALTIGAGVGYRIGRDIRFGINFDRSNRQSPLQLRDFTGYRIGGTVTYAP